MFARSPPRRETGSCARREKPKRLPPPPSVSGPASRWPGSALSIPVASNSGLPAYQDGRWVSPQLTEPVAAESGGTIRGSGAGLARPPETARKSGPASAAPVHRGVSESQSGRPRSLGSRLVGRDGFGGRIGDHDRTA